MNDFREAMAAACFGANGNLMRWEDAPEKLRDGWRGVADEVIAALPDSLDAAWGEAKAAAAEKGWRLDLLEWGGGRDAEGPMRDVWTASAYDLGPVIGRIDAEAPTPSAALRALAAKLREVGR
jgi:hypothetical protein